MIEPAAIRGPASEYSFLESSRTSTMEKPKETHVSRRVVGNDDVTSAQPSGISPHRAIRALYYVNIQLFLFLPVSRAHARLGYRGIVTDTEEKGKRTAGKACYVAETKKRRQRYAYIPRAMAFYKSEGSFSRVNDPPCLQRHVLHRDLSLISLTSYERRVYSSCETSNSNLLLD